MLLLDTDVMIDILRRHDPALDWLRELGDESIGLPGLVAMELLQGCRNQTEQRRVEGVLQAYILYWPTHTDCRRAIDSFVATHLSHGIGVLDALIAETAIGLGVPLATFNQKHYRAIAALQTVQPYIHS
jgi:predicted nucleic acid-binding protein